MKYSIVIPCYNESENIYNMVEILKKFEGIDNTEFILVENGSKDDSREKFEKIFKKTDKHLKAVYVDKNKGYGYGIQQGLKEATGKYVGWLHADLQVNPNELLKFYNYLENNNNELVYLKGSRRNRSFIDYFFTMGMTIFESLLFKKWMSDICAMPVLFNRELLNEFKKAPYDFSLDLFSYYQAKKNNYKVKKFPVNLLKRENGKSSWNTGIMSRIRQSIVIMKNSIRIKRGEHIK